MTADYELHAALMADAAPQSRPAMVTPRPWPDGVEPTTRELAEWLRVCTVAEREWWVERAREDMATAIACFMLDHAGRLAEKGARR